MKGGDILPSSRKNMNCAFTKSTFTQNSVEKLPGSPSKNRSTGFAYVPTAWICVLLFAITSAITFFINFRQLGISVAIMIFAIAGLAKLRRKNPNLSDPPSDSIPTSNSEKPSQALPEAGNSENTYLANEKSPKKSNKTSVVPIKNSTVLAKNSPLEENSKENSRSRTRSTSKDFLENDEAVEEFIARLKNSPEIPHGRKKIKLPSSAYNVSAATFKKKLECKNRITLSSKVAQREEDSPSTNLPAKGSSTF